jgi:hypothetical protein
MTWWNDSYTFRKELAITTLSSGSPVSTLVLATVDFASLIAKGTVRSDRDDVEVVYETADATPSYTVLGRSFYLSYLAFESPVELPDTGTFYMYYGNSTLTNQPSRPSYTLDLYPIEVAYDGQGVSYTRPGEHWIDGSSYTVNAVTTFLFSGSQIKVTGIKGPEKGQAVVTIDNGTEEELDFFAETESEQTVYTKTGLTAGVSHEIAFRVSEKKNPASLDKTVTLTKYNYPGSATVSLGVEENDITLWTSFFGGDD